MKHFNFFLIAIIFAFSPINSPAAGQTGKIRGRVIDAHSAEPLETVQIYPPGTDIGTVSDRNGYFEISLPPDMQFLVFRMAGYRCDTLQVDPLQAGERNLYIYLERKSYEYDPVTVTESRRPAQNSSMELILDIGLFSSKPSLGELDVFRLVQNLPGVTFTNDFSALLYIRGSNYDQSQIAFDDVPVLNAYHLGGLYSGFNPDGVCSVEFSPGISDPRYGGYLGGRINIVPQDGMNPKRYHGKLSLGLLSTKFSYGNRIGKNSFFLAGRRSYFDLVENMASGEIGTYYYLDLQAGYKRLLNEDNILSLHCYYSRDYLRGVLNDDEQDEDHLIEPRWGNRIVSLKWRHLGSSWSWLSQLYFSAGAVYSDTKHINIDNRLENLGMRQTFNRKAGRHDILAGMEMNRNLYRGDWLIQDAYELENIIRPPEHIFFDYAPSQYGYKDRVSQLVLFAQDAVHLTPVTVLAAGIRSAWYEETRQFFVSPMLRIRRDLSETITLQANYARPVQYFYTLKTVRNSDFFSPFAAFFPVRSGEKPLQADYFSLGLEARIRPDIVLRMEGYAKVMKHIPIISRYRSHEKLSQRQFSSGLDVYIAREISQGLSYSASYSLGFDRIRQDSLLIRAPYNRLHQFKAEMSHLSKSGWQIGLRFFYLSGLPYTPIVGKFVGAGTGEDNDIVWSIEHSLEYSGNFGFLRGEENSLRFPAYHRLDLDVSKAWYFKHSRLWLKIQVMNLYNRKNPMEYRWDLYYQGAMEDNTYNFPVIPSFEIIYEF